SYVALVVVPLVALVVLLRVGALSTASMPGVPVPPKNHALGLLNLPLMLGQILVILIVSRLLGLTLRRLGQPQVIGEMLTGLLLGHSVLGVLAPGVHDALFPRGSLRFLNALSQIGVLMFMFLVGLELDRGLVLRRGRAALLTSHASMALPLFM